MLRSLIGSLVFINYVGRYLSDLFKKLHTIIGLFERERGYGLMHENGPLDKVNPAPAYFDGKLSFPHLEVALALLKEHIGGLKWHSAPASCPALREVTIKGLRATSGIKISFGMN